MRTDTEAFNAIAKLERRVAHLELWDKRKRRRIAVLEERVILLEQPETPPEERADARARRQVDAGFMVDHAVITAVNEGLAKRDAAWMQELKEKFPGCVRPLPDGSELWSIVYRHASQAGFNPTFLHVRATNSTGALMAFIARTTEIEVDAVYEEGKGEGSGDERIKKILDAVQGKVLDAIEEGLECECPFHVASYSAKNHNASCPYGRAVNAFKAFRESL